LQIAQAYLQHGDPAMAARTWQHVMEQIHSTKRGNTRQCWRYAIMISSSFSVDNNGHQKRHAR
jgi:hypothetical protein